MRVQFVALTCLFSIFLLCSSTWLVANWNSRKSALPWQNLTPSLATIFTPLLYQHILHLYFPWQGAVDIKFATRYYFSDNMPEANDDTSILSALQALNRSFQATQILSDLSIYIPQSSHAESTLALIILLDQGARAVCHENGRCSHLYDATSQYLVRTLISSDTFPDSYNIWEALGYGFEDIMLRKMFLTLPLVHSQRPEDQKIARIKVEGMRTEVERWSGRFDPWRKSKSEEGINELLSQGPPETSPEIFFWLYHIFDTRTSEG